jgi:hypothetical protein
MVARLLVALLSLLRGPQSACIESRRDVIIAAAEAGERDHGVPPVILLVIGFAESHLGCDVGEGGGWGAPISRTRRHTAGTPDHAARALARSYEVCGTWLGAVSRFRCGLCRCPRLRGYDPTDAMRLVDRVSTRAGTPAPTGAP